MVNAFSLDSLSLSLRTNSQNLVIVKPSVARVIFLSNNKSSSFCRDDDSGDGATTATDVVSASGVNVSDIDLFERLYI
ncbi:MAG TPA: hypothetical protein VIR31_03470 [Nitrososphaeraceae archaeon]|jgi:hypothetical protein